MTNSEIIALQCPEIFLTRPTDYYFFLIFFNYLTIMSCSEGRNGIGPISRKKHFISQMYGLTGEINCKLFVLFLAILAHRAASSLVWGCSSTQTPEWDNAAKRLFTREEGCWQWNGQTQAGCRDCKSGVSAPAYFWFYILLDPLSHLMTIFQIRHLRYDAQCIDLYCDFTYVRLC